MLVFGFFPLKMVGIGRVLSLVVVAVCWVLWWLGLSHWQAKNFGFFFHGWWEVMVGVKLRW